MMNKYYCVGRTWCPDTCRTTFYLKCSVKDLTKRKAMYKVKKIYPKALFGRMFGYELLTIEEMNEFSFLRKLAEDDSDDKHMIFSSSNKEAK